ncbi:MAG: transposase zinc-binding domain-containing protein [Myxococcota bacterium]
MFARGGLSPQQRHAAHSNTRCRTQALGGYACVCDECGVIHAAYNACRDRHCPSCQSLARRPWIGRRIARVLPAARYHVVFTLPDGLRPIARFNQAPVGSELLRAAAAPLLDFGHATRAPSASPRPPTTNPAGRRGPCHESALPDAARAPSQVLPASCVPRPTRGLAASHSRLDSPPSSPLDPSRLADTAYNTLRSPWNSKSAG